MKSTQTLAICDLNAAVAAPWDTKTCLGAQSAARTFNAEIKFCGYSGPEFYDGRKVNFPLKVSRLMQIFDVAKWNGSDHLIAEIRRQLPMEVEVEMEIL